MINNFKRHKAETIAALPEVHRPGGLRSLHDDFPWPFSLIPRWWFAAPQGRCPRLIFGNQNFWNYEDNSAWALGAEIKTVPGDSFKFIEKFGPKPVGQDGEWQISICYPKILGVVIPCPYFAFTSYNGFHFRIGLARWSEGSGERYYELFVIAIKNFKELLK